MPETALPALVRRLARVAAGPAGRDEAAFAALVARHGPLALDVCRAVAGNHADAADAFQATFLLLARRADAVRRPASLAAWLYGVAYRVALKARTRAARRRQREARLPAPEPAAAPDDPSWAEVRAAVHEGLAALGERYRAVLVLCYLDGLTRERAAAALGLTPAAVKKRLERGRAMLRAALSRRGLGPAAVLAAVALPVVPPSLAASAARVATRPAAVPPHVRTLTRGATPMTAGMLAATLCLLPALVAGAVLAAAPAPGGPPPAPAAAPADDRKDAAAGRDAEPLDGTWSVRHVETGGKPLFDRDALADARVTFDGNRATVRGLRVPFVSDFTFKLDPARTPGAIDVTFLAGQKEGKTFDGVYIVRGDEARICLRLEHPERGRPRGFVTGGGTTLYTFILDRAKGPAPDARGAARTGAPAITVGELAAELRKKGFRWNVVGRQITFNATVLRPGAKPEVRIDGLEKDHFDQAVLHNALADNQLKAGDRVRVTGLIVDQFYGVWQVWKYELRAVAR